MTNHVHLIIETDREKVKWLTDLLRTMNDKCIIIDVQSDDDALDVLDRFVINTCYYLTESRIRNSKLFNFKKHYSQMSFVYINSMFIEGKKDDEGLNTQYVINSSRKVQTSLLIADPCNLFATRN